MVRAIKWVDEVTSINPVFIRFILIVIHGPQGGGGSTLRDNLGDPGRAGLQLLCARGRHHNDCGWNGHLQHRKECTSVQGDFRFNTRLKLQ